MTRGIFQGQIFSNEFVFPVAGVELGVWLALSLLSSSLLFFSEALIQYSMLLFPMIATTIC